MPSGSCRKALRHPASLYTSSSRHDDLFLTTDYITQPHEYSQHSAQLHDMILHQDPRRFLHHLTTTCILHSPREKGHGFSAAFTFFTIDGRLSKLLYLYSQTRLVELTHYLAFRPRLMLYIQKVKINLLRLHRVELNRDSTCKTDFNNPTLIPRYATNPCKPATCHT